MLYNRQGNDRKEKLRQVFEDTEKCYLKDETLKGAIEESIKATKIYKENHDFQPFQKKYEQTIISVNKFKSLETGVFYHKKNPDSRIGILNFASATHPGGGVREGSSAQEESLCRCTTLFPVLDTEKNRKEFYEFHRRRHDQRYTDAAIYTPNIVAFKTDDAIPSLLPPNKWDSFDFISCAAPNLRTLHIKDAELLKLHEQRARQILHVASENEVDILVLGAFGCGAFKNDPETVAEAYKKVLTEFEGGFREITFAVYTTPRDRRNFDAFSKILLVR